MTISVAGGTLAPVTDRPESVDFYFDVMCPYAYQSSKWIREVRARTGVAVRWRFFSLEEINRVDGKKHPWERPWSYGWSQMRIGAWLRRPSAADTGADDGNLRLDRWYETVGRAFHEEGRQPHDPVVHRAILDDLGFGAGLLDEAMADPSTTDEVRADHDYAVQVYGAFGVPTIVFPPAAGDDVTGTAVYQQLVPAPTGADAVELFDLTVAFNRFPQLFELRHPKRVSDLASVVETFEPYLRARAWNTIENPAP